MNQKNIFSGISVVLILQGIMFYFMRDNMVTDTFPAVDANGHSALMTLLEVMAALSVLIGIVTWGNRSTPNIAGNYTLGALVLLCVTMKHLLVDHIPVPVFAWVIQVLIALACAYLWLGKKS